MKEYVVIFIDDAYYLAYKVTTEVGIFYTVDNKLELNGFENVTDAFGYAYHLEKVKE